MSDDDLAARRVAVARHWNGVDLPSVSFDDVDAVVPHPCVDPSTTVVTPCHDDGVFLVDALASVRLCASENIEMIVVDDHSTDPTTLELLERISDAGVSVLHSPGRGANAARNVALAKASGELIVPLDADNLLRPGFVAAAATLLDQHADVAAVHSDAMRFGLEVGLWPAPTPPVPDLLCGNQLDMCSVIRRSALESVGGWDIEVFGSEDWATWVALLAHGWKLATVPLVGFDYRMRSGSLRSTLTPQVRYDQLMHLVGRYPEIYARHVEAVIANFAGAMVVARPEDGDPSAMSPTERALVDRLSQLADELAAAQEAAATARWSGAIAADAAREQTESSERERTKALERAERAEAHVATLESTMLFRLARRPRAWYGRARKLLGR